jgi:LPS sulfotransferase NodH
MNRFALRQPRGFLDAVFRSYGAEIGIRPFVVIFLPRTGSNFLASALDSHPEILCHHEVFNFKSPHRSLSARSGELQLSLGTAQERDSNPWAFLSKMFSSVGVWKSGEPNHVSAIGAKLSPYDNAWVFLALLLNRRVKKIVMRRDNFLETFVSAEFASQTGEWAVFDGAGAGPKKPGQVHVDVSKLRAYCRKSERFYRLLNIAQYVTGQRFHFVEYAKCSQQAELIDATTFLGVATGHSMAARTVRQADRSLSERIDNFDEVRLALNNTPWCRFTE